MTASNGTMELKTHESNHCNENGTVKKGHKQWIFFKTIWEIETKNHQELCPHAGLH